MLINIEDYIKKLNILPRGVIHLGAHKGEELNLYRKLKVTNILLYEANKNLIKFLNLKSFFFKFLFKINIKVINKIIYNKNKSCRLNITSNTQSSSILNLGLHKKLYPNIVFKEESLVEGSTLNSEFKNFYNINDFNILNMDIQGSELLALLGANQIIDKLDVIYTEINYDYVYEECALINEIDEYLNKHNFIRFATKIVNDDHGKPVWGDALYVQKKFIS
jgi:FkbM family methyltransferase